jgi:hypothetical protein
MLILEIALAVVLAVLILRYLPQLLGVGIGVVVLCILLIAAIAIFENYPRFLGTFLLCAAVLGIEKYTPTINWPLLFFSSFLAFIISMVLIVGVDSLLEPVKLSKQIPLSWRQAGSFIIFSLCTWLIYRLAWSTKSKNVSQRRAEE